MSNLKYGLGISFITAEDVDIRDGFIPKGTLAKIDEVDENEYDAEGTQTAYRVFFFTCLTENNNSKVDDEGTEIGGSDWFSEAELMKIMSTT